MQIILTRIPRFVLEEKEKRYLAGVISPAKYRLS